MTSPRPRRSDPGPADPPPTRRRRTTVSLGAFALLLIGAVAVAVLGPPDSSPRYPGPGAPMSSADDAARDIPDEAAADRASVPGGGVPAPTSAPAPAPAPAEPCPVLDASDQRVPAQPPQDVSWSVFHGLLVPSSPRAGPAVAEEEVQRCFARTPTGALLAAVQISARYFLAADWRLVADRCLTPGPVRDAAMDRRAVRERIGGVPSDPPTESLVQVAGYHFDSYTPDRAVVRVIRGGGSPAYDRSGEPADGIGEPADRTGEPDGGDNATSAVYTLEWSGGDWRIHLRPDGSDAETPSRTAEADSAVPWGAGAW